MSGCFEGSEVAPAIVIRNTTPLAARQAIRVYIYGTFRQSHDTFSDCFRPIESSDVLQTTSRSRRQNHHAKGRHAVFPGLR